MREVGGYVGLAFAFLSPVWALVTFVGTAMALDPPPAPSRKPFAMWLILSAPLGLIVGVLLLLSSLALLRADRRATRRALAAAVASGIIVIGMTVLLLTALPKRLDALSATILLAPWFALGVSVAQWRIASQDRSSAES